MNKSILSYGVAMMLFASSCSDNFEPFQTNPSTEESENGRVSYFDIDPLLMILESTENIGYANLKSGFFDISTHDVDVKRNTNGYRCGIFLHESMNIEDGIYLLTFSDADHQPIEGMIKVTVKDDKVIEVGEAESSFSLRQGSGTQTDPYIIGSARDFLTFLDDLRENELTNGRDVWFQQTADIELMDQSSTKPGRGYFGYSFAGHYNGGGYALKGLYYRGAANPDSDTRVGIFPSLLDGATVSNLTISGVNVSETYQDTGALAGTTKGTVSLSGLKMTGSVISDDATNVGAFIGRMENGMLTATDIELDGSVVGKSKVGGIIGCVGNGTAEFSRIKMPKQHFSVEGYERTGGIAGGVYDSSIKVFDSEMHHVVSNQDADIRIVCTSGGDDTGGLIGYVGGSSTAELRNVTVSCPVGGLNRTGNHIGGLIGSVKGTGNVILQGCRMTSIVSGAKEIGGYIGHCEITGNSKLHIEGESKENYIVPDDSAAGIEGVSQAGGAFGQLSTTAIAASSGARIRVAVNVDASDCDCGGAIGKVTDTTVALSLFDMTSSTMQVTGIKRTGGMVGYANHATLTGDTPFDYAMEGDKAIIPDKDAFRPIFTGIVKGKNQTGGILGYGENVTLKALTAGCTVETTEGEHIGGVVGRLLSKGTGNRFEDLVSKSEVTAQNSRYVGGVVGYLYSDRGFCYTTDCINFGNVKGGDPTGGIFGYVHQEYMLHENDIESFKPIEIRWCFNAGEISGSNKVGGIVGESSTTDATGYWYTNYTWIYKCGNNGHISSDSKTQAASGVGGIVGYAEDTLLLEHNSNNGTISSYTAHKGVGGIAGSLGLDATKNYKTYCYNVDVYKCVNNGTVDSTDPSSRAGGILGFMEEGPHSYIKDCINRGEILHKHNSDNGGILGYIDHLGNVYYCFNMGNVEEGNATIGTHKTGSTFSHEGLYMLDGSGWTWPSANVIKKEDLCNESKYYWLNFDRIWIMTDNGPALRDCPFDFCKK